MLYEQRVALETLEACVVGALQHVRIPVCYLFRCFPMVTLWFTPYRIPSSPRMPKRCRTCRSPNFVSMVGPCMVGHLKSATVNLSFSAYAMSGLQSEGRLFFAPAPPPPSLLGKALRQAGTESRGPRARAWTSGIAEP